MPMKGTKRKRAAQSSKAPAAEQVALAEQIVQPEIPAEAVAEILEVAPAVEADMPVAPAQAAAAANIVLQVNCGVRDVVEFRNSLLGIIESETAVIIDATQVERIDTAALQVLAAFVRDRRSRERQVTWLHVNEVLSEAARTLGLVASLGIPDLQAEVA
jgi:anti-anti-sigma regulatory factor